MNYKHLKSALLLSVISLFVVSLTSCGGSDDDTILPIDIPSKPDTPITPSQDVVELKAGYTYTILDGKGKIWTSSNPKIASIDDNVVTANKVGTVTVSTAADNGKSITVRVLPSFNYYTEPYINWGASRSAVKSAVSLQIYDETSSKIIYNGTGNVGKYYYEFENGLLTNVEMTTSLSASQIEDFLWERYIPAGEISSGIKMFLSIDGKTVILWDVASSMILYGNFGSSNINSPELKAMVSKMSSVK